MLLGAGSANTRAPVPLRISEYASFRSTQYSDEETVMTDKIYNVLFLCTGNSARSILAEALLNRDGEGRFRAFSAGSFPKGDVHPQSLSLIYDLGFYTAGLRSNSSHQFPKPNAPPFP